jgi:hypothetical protein
MAHCSENGNENFVPKMAGNFLTSSWKMSAFWDVAPCVFRETSVNFHENIGRGTPQSVHLYTRRRGKLNCL